MVPGSVGFGQLFKPAELKKTSKKLLEIYQEVFVTKATPIYNLIVENARYNAADELYRYYKDSGAPTQKTNASMKKLKFGKLEAFDIDSFPAVNQRISDVTLQNHVYHMTITASCKVTGSLEILKILEAEFGSTT